MVTDPLFYQLFETSPETFFLLLGMSVETARDMASRYQYQAIEFKETSHRSDGVFLPREPGLPLYFLENQFYSLPSVYADLLVKVYTYLKQNNPGQKFCGVVLFSQRSLEPVELDPYQPLLDAGYIRPFYLDEMPEVEQAPIGLSILDLIRQSDAQAPHTARKLIGRVNLEVEDDAIRANLVRLIETVIIYKLPRLSREEIETMLQVRDIRETLVFQEAKAEGMAEGKAEGKAEGRVEGKAEGRAEGKEEGRAEGKEEGRVEGRAEGKAEALRQVIVNLLSSNLSVEQIAQMLKMDVESVRQSLVHKNQT